MTKSTTFHVGQAVLLLDGLDLGRGKRNPQEATVTRVGRTNVAIMRYGREMQFDMATGYEKRSVNAVGLGSVIFTPEQFVEKEQRRELLSDLATLGIHSDARCPLDGYSTDALSKVRDLLRADLAR